jgi:ring-1,2-phenylacetyl-CoA epoxidase subunit PaaD
MKQTIENTTTSFQEEQKLWEILREVKDPEIPVMSIVDLGIVRTVHCFLSNSGECRGEVTITPTYSGCPAMDIIRMDIRLKLLEHGYKNIAVHQSLSPAWTSDWITEEGKRKLKEFGIAPPNPKQQFCTSEMFREEAVQCPFCNSYHTKQISRFGSTACKAVYQCDNCQETFDYFKCH